MLIYFSCMLLCEYAAMNKTWLWRAWFERSRSPVIGNVQNDFWDHHLSQPSMPVIVKRARRYPSSTLQSSRIFVRVEVSSSAHITVLEAFFKRAKMKKMKVPRSSTATKISTEKHGKEGTNKKIQAKAQCYDLLKGSCWITQCVKKQMNFERGFLSHWGMNERTVADYSHTKLDLQLTAFWAKLKVI